MKTPKRALLLFALSFGAAACSEGPDPLVDAGPIDAGGTPDLCTDDAPCILTPGARSSDWLSPEGDSDPFLFDVPAAGKVVNIVVENDAEFSPIRLEVVLFEPGGMSIENRRFQGNGRQRVEIQLVAPSAGRYRIVVRDVGGDGQDRLNPYYVTVTILDETDNNEPNDTSAEAVPLTAGVPVSGTIGFELDEDWFSIDVPANRLVQVELTAPGTSALRFSWELWDPTATVRIAASLEPTADVAWPVENRAVGNAGGTYFLRVIDDPEDGVHAELTRIYQLVVRLEAEPDVNDVTAPNETALEGTWLTAGTPVTGYIAATSDVDYYRIAVPAATPARPALIVVEAEMNGASPVDLSFSVLARDGEALVCEDRDGDLCEGLRFVTDGATAPARLRTAHVITAAGTYYVLVRDQQDNEFDTATSYRLTVSLPAEPDANETYSLEGRRDAQLVPAATSTAGTTITYPWVTGFISHANDEDWYQFDLPGPAGASPGQNGDWQVQLELQIPGPTPVELEAFFYGPAGSQRSSYGGYGKRCRDPDPNDREPCQYPDADNAISRTFGAQQGECFVVFREITGEGPHYFRMSDLDRDDFDLTAQYRFRVTVTAGCPVPGVCELIYTGPNGDLCGRP